MKTAFETWIEDADMPSLVDGQWVDMETGISFASFSAPRFQLSNKASTARNTAKMFGGKALKGTAKQKEWAEKIRAEKIQGISLEQAVMLCDPNGLGKDAKFWIENRNKNASEFGSFIEEQKGLLKQYRTAQSKKNAEMVKSISEKYNALTAKWGF